MNEVDKLAEKVAEVAMNPKSLDWNSLPPELKIHCINQMDFQTKTGLRSTTKTEMGLVDSVKHSFDNVKIHFDLDALRIVCFQPNEYVEARFATKNEENEQATEPTDISKVSQQIAALLKRVLSAKINNLSIHVVPESDICVQKLVTEVITQGPVLNVKKLEFPILNGYPIGIETLKHSSTDSLSIIIISSLNTADTELLKQLPKIPQVINCQRFIISGAPNGEQERRNKILFWGLCLMNCFENCPPVGNKIKIEYLPDVIDGTKNCFESQVISHNEAMKAVRMKTNNPSKHFWLRFLPNSIEPKIGTMKMFVVDANSEDVDFKKLDEEKEKKIEELWSEFEKSWNPSDIDQLLKRIGPIEFDAADYDEDDWNEFYY